MCRCLHVYYHHPPPHLHGSLQPIWVTRMFHCLCCASPTRENVSSSESPVTPTSKYTTKYNDINLGPRFLKLPCRGNFRLLHNFVHVASTSTSTTFRQAGNIFILYFFSTSARNIFIFYFLSILTKPSHPAKQHMLRLRLRHSYLC